MFTSEFSTPQGMAGSHESGYPAETSGLGFATALRQETARRRPNCGLLHRPYTTQ
jgi:hypothetical protein